MLKTWTLKRSCDYCVQRKRPCDGFARRRCSLCIVTEQPECHYRPRRRRSQTSGHDDDTAPAPRAVGRSFWSTDGKAASALTGGSRRPSSAGSGSGGRPLSGVLLPFKRGQFSASPATGLIGLQENEFLGDFFGCLGFLSLTSESTVRGALVRVMLTGASLQQQKHHHHPGAPSLPNLKPGLVVGEDAVGVQQGVGESSGTSSDSGWGSALAADRESGALPRDASMCTLWCAIALGALVRGFPLDHVGRYVELAQDSLRACYDRATFETARAYVAMAVVYNFLGEPVKNHEYIKLANNIADALPQEKMPRGFRELLQYAGYAWVIEPDLASVEDIKDYWENVTPIWQLSETVMERDVCGHVLTVNVRVNQPFVDETGVSRVLIAQQQDPSQEITPIPAGPAPIEEVDASQGEEGVEPVSVGSAEACTSAHKSVLTEMSRLEGCLRSSNMHMGLGGLLYYGNLSYLQLMHKEPMSKESFARTIDVFLRYPGLCRYNIWFHYVHSHLFFLSKSRRRREYDALRAAYNSARPPGCPPAPPFEGCRTISDVCDHSTCKRVTERIMSLLLDYYKEAARNLEPAFLV